MEIAELLREIVGKPDAVILIAKVDKLYPDQFTCDVSPIDGSAPIKNVRLTPLLGSAAFVAIPEKGSFVSVAMLNRNEAVIISVNKAEKIILRGETYGGLVKVKELVNRLNTIEKALNDFLNEFKSHSHLDPVSGALPPPVSFVQPITPLTDRDDLENKEVTHG